MSNGVSRFFGGSPVWVIVRLALLSVLVGVILHALGLDPWDIVNSLTRLVRQIWFMGWDAIESLWRYFLLGAVIVVPVWLIIRIARAPRNRS